MLSFQESAVLALISILIGLSQTAGIGGGPIINICLMLNYEEKISISLTYIFLIGGSLASVWKNGKKKVNKETGGSFVSLELVLVTMPVMSSGAFLGVMGKNYLSELWVSVFFVVIFLYLIWDIVKNIKKIQKKTASQAQTQIRIQSTQRSLEQQSRSEESPSAPQLPSAPAPSPKKSKLTLTILLACTYYTVTVLFQILKGSIHYKSLIGIDSCGLAGFAFVVVHFGMSVVVSRFVVRWLRAERAGRGDGVGIVDEIPLDDGSVNKLLVGGFSAGVLGATLAIGGAPILIPIWLNCKIDHNTASSTTPILILLSSLISFTISALNESYSQTPTPKLLLFLSLSFLSSALIKDLLTYIAQKYKIKILVIVLLLFVIVISLLVLVPYQIVKLIGDYQGFVRFGVFC